MEKTAARQHSGPFYILIIFRMNFKVSLGMRADRADFRRLFTYYNVTAVPAFPNLDRALLKYFLVLHVFQQGAIPLFMMLKPSASAVLAKPSYISVHS